MADEVIATEAIVEAIAPQEDLEAKVAALEAEKAALLKDAEAGANYRIAYLKEKNRNANADESDEDKMRRIALETLNDSRLAVVNAELEATTKRALKELKEAKLALANKTDIPVSTTTSTETTTAVKDTLITPEQMANFKKMGWSDDKIARYKKNLIKNTR